MSIAVLQISDLHILSSSKTLDDEARQVAASLRARCATLSILVVVVSGDVAFSGSTEEYERAQQLLETLIVELKKNEGLVVEGPVIVPGNHDCQLQANDDAREGVLDNVSRRISEIDESSSSVRELTKAQDNFFAFERIYSGQERIGWNRLYYSKLVKSGQESILIHCYNTSWVSRLDEVKGQIVVAEKIQPVHPNELPSVVVSVFHHPYSWFASGNSKKFQRTIESLSDVVLTGHEHEQDNFARDSSFGQHVEYVESAAFRAKGIETGFNLIVIDEENKKYEIVPFRRGGGLFQAGTGVTRAFSRNPKLLDRYFENNVTFRTRLIQLEGPFSHPKKRILELDDVFVYPDLNARGALEKKSRNVDSKNVLDFVYEKKRIHMSGDSFSGKTTLGRRLYLDLQEKFNLVPVLLSGEDLHGNPTTCLNAAVDRQFRDQYSAEQLGSFRALPKERTALIIDDWNRSPFNTKARLKLMALAEKQFDVVITLTSAGASLQEILDSADAQDLSEEFYYCEIKEFGHKLRSQLAERWRLDESDFEIEESDAVHRLSASENILESIIGNGVIPSRPFFILYVLQETGQQSQGRVANGSYGHVYEALLAVRLKSVSSKSTDVGTYYTYLSIVAHRMFATQSKSLNPEAMRAVQQEFLAEYDMPEETESILRKLRSARILDYEGNSVFFPHKYCYYFFVANYFKKALADNHDDPYALGHLTDMVEMVHDEEFMNILIFYIYMTEDRRLIEQLLKNSRDIFAEYAPCNFTSDFDFVANFMKPRHLSIDITDVRRNREDYWERVDKSPPPENGITPLVRTKYSRELSESLRIDFSIRSLQVMGQVLRNFPGVLRKDLKVDLATECYRLGLRCLKRFITLFETQGEQLRRVYETRLARHEAVPRDKFDKLEASSAQLLTVLAEGMIVGMVKTVAFSVGSEDLKNTLETVRTNAGDGDIGTRMIDLSVRLDHFAKTPMDEIDSLTDDIAKSNVVAWSVLRMLVAHHIYLFPVGWKNLQRLGATFEINTKALALGPKKRRS
jgi:hypothetical protein